MSCLRPCGIPCIPALLVLILGILTHAPAPAAAAEEGESVQDWLSGMELFYEAHPQLKTTPGSGWKPYTRLKWFVEQRMVDGELAPAGARWEASRERLRREHEAGSLPRTTWFSAGPMDLSGRILDIEFHPTNPDIVYIGSASGGLWKSTDNGLSYVTTTDQLPVLSVGAVAVLPWNPDIVLMGTGEGNGAGVWGVGMLRSTDAGLSWQPTSLNYLMTNHHGFNAIEANPATGTLLAAARDGLWRSTDEGQNWTRVGTGLWYDVKWKPGDPLRVYAARGANGAGDGVHVSTDDGLSFALLGVGQPDPTTIGKTKIAVTPANPGILYANYCNRLTNESLGIWRSLDSGATWTARSTVNIGGGQAWYNLTIAADPNNADRIIAGGVGLYASDDGGLTLAETGGGNGMGDQTHVHVDHHAVAYEPGSTSAVWVGCDGGVWRSADDGHTWLSRREGLVTYQFYDIAVAQTHPVFLVGGTQDNGIPGRTGPTTWFPTGIGTDGMVCNITPTNAQFVYGEAQNGWHVKSVNGGLNWFPINSGLSGNGFWVTPVDQDQIDVLTLFTATTAGIFRSTTGGNVWANVAGYLSVWLSISRVNHDVVWSVYHGAAMRSLDGGDTWQISTGFSFPHGGATKILAHPTDANAAFVTFSGYSAGARRVVLTEDLGATWQNVTGDLPDVPVSAIAVDPLIPSDWYVGTDTGVWISQDGGAHWLPCETGLPHTVVTDLEINVAGRKLVAGTYGRGVWELTLPDPTGVSEGSSLATLHLMLDPPYPNPASGATTLRFAARDAGQASLDIYDVSGRRMTHVADVRSDGLIRLLSWTPPAELASGAYFAVLRAGDEQVSQKIILRR